MVSITAVYGKPRMSGAVVCYPGHPRRPWSDVAPIRFSSSLQEGRDGL